MKRDDKKKKKILRHDKRDVYPNKCVCARAKVSVTRYDYRPVCKTHNVRLCTYSTAGSAGQKRQRVTSF